MQLQRVRYTDLNGRQKEIYNFQKLAGVLADYGFNCIKLADDWQGADFLAYHKDGTDTLRVQQKPRFTIAKMYMGKGLYMAFPAAGHWYLIEHDALVDLAAQHANYLATRSWQTDGKYTAAQPSAALRAALEPNKL